MNCTEPFFQVVYRTVTKLNVMKCHDRNKVNYLQNLGNRIAIFHCWPLKLLLCNELHGLVHPFYVSMYVCLTSAAMSSRCAI